METTQQYTHEIATIIPQGMNGNNSESNISYEEYKALEAGFLEEKRKLEDRMWLDSNMSQFDEILRQNYDSSLRKFSEKVITHIAKVTGAVYGAFFTVDYDSHTVNATGGYACTVETMDRTSFNLGEGLVGQVAKSKDLLCLDNVETQLDSSLGRISACFLAISPLVFNDRVYGIVELTTLSKLKPRYIILLERMSRSVAAVLQSLINNQRTKELLIESLQQSEDFKSQRDELHKRDELLQSLREQLQRKEQEMQGLIGNFESNEAGVSAESFSKLNSELLEAQTALERMRAEWQQQQAEIVTLTNSQSNIVVNEEVLNHQEQQIKDLQESLHWKHEEIERQGNVLQERKQEIEKLQNEILEKENENKRFLEEIIRQEKSLQQKEQALASLHTQLQEAIANAHVPVEMAQLQELLLQKENLYTQLQEALEQEHLKYVEQVESMEKASAEIDAKSLAYENLEQQWHTQTQIWQSWQQTAQEREAELQTLQTEIEAKNTLLASLNTDFAQINAVFTQLKSDYQIQQDVLTALKEEATQKETLLQEQSEALRQRETENQRQQREIQDLQTRLSKKEDELLVTQYMLNQMQANPLIGRETERLSKELEAKELEIKALQNQIANTEYEAKVNELLMQIEAQNETIVTLQNEAPNTENEAKINTLVAEIATLHDTIEALKQENSEQANELQELIASQRDLVEKLENQPNIAESEAKITALLEQITAQSQIIEDLQNKAEKAETETQTQELLAQLDEQNGVIEQMQEEAKRYTEAFESVNKSFEEASEDLENIKQYASLKENEVEHLQKLLQETESQTEAPEISNMIAELREKEALVEDLTEKLNAYSLPDEYVQKQYSHIQQKIKDLEIVQQHLADREAELNYLQETLEAQKEQLTKNNGEQTETIRQYQEQEELAQLRNQITFKQQEISKRETELADLFNKINTTFAMLEIDVHGKIMSVNNKLLFHLGLSLEEMLYENYSKFLKPQYAESHEYKQLWQELITVGTTQTIENFVLIGRKEREVNMNVTFIPILDASGKPYEIIQLVNFFVQEETTKNKEETIQEVQEAQETVSINAPAKEAEQDFDEEREIFKAIQNSFMLLELDVQGRITTVNYQMALCLGYQEQELVGKFHVDLLHEDVQDSENYQDILARLSEGHYATEVLTYLGKEKEKIVLRSYFNPLKDKEDKTRKVLVMSQYVH